MKYNNSMPELEPIPDPLHLEGSPIHEDEAGNVIIENREARERALKYNHEEHTDRNLAEIIPPHILARIIEDLDRAIESDLESRTPWINMQETGVKYMGLQIEKREKPWVGACGVYSSKLMQAILTTSHTIIRETLPSRGPAKAHVEGFSNEHKDKASQKWEAFFNHYFTRINKSFYPDFKEAITTNCVPMGSVPFKIYRIKGERWPSIFYIKPQDLVVNTSATSLHMADRITHILYLTERELKTRQLSGLYRNIDLQPATDDQAAQKNNLQQTIDRIKGIDSINREFNKEYISYESCANINLGYYWDEADDGTDFPKPYIITYDKSTKQCLGFYENWQPEDKFYKRKNVYVNFPLISGFGVCGIGYFHLLSGNAIAATALIRQMVDLGTVSSFPGGLRRKGVKFLSSELLVGPGDFIEVDTGSWSLEQCFSPMPYRDPSPVLKEMIDDFQQNIMDLAGASMATITETPANTPPTTVLAVLDQQQIIQSVIVQNIHTAFTEMFEILYEFFKESIEEDPYFFQHYGKTFDLTPEDIMDGISIIPVSDPNLSSFPKRAMTAENMVNMMERFPQYHKPMPILKRYYSIYEIQNVDEILQDPDEQPDMQPKDPIAENADAMQGKPLKAFSFQNHQAHNTVHRQEAQDPNFPQENLSALLAHISEHDAMGYMINMYMQIGMPMPEDVSQIPPEAQNEIAMMAAQVVQQQQQQAEANQPPPLTPEQVMLEDVKVKQEKNQMDFEISNRQRDYEDAKLDLERRRAEYEKEAKNNQLYIEELKVVQEGETQHMKAEVELAKAEIQGDVDHNNILAEDERSRLDRVHDILESHLEHLHKGDLNEQNIIAKHKAQTPQIPEGELQ